MTKRCKFFRILLNIEGSGSFLDFMISVGFVRGTSSFTRLDTRSLFVETDIDSLFIGIRVEVRELIALI